MIKYVFGHWMRKGKLTPSKTHIYFHDEDTVSLCGISETPTPGVRSDSDLCQQCILRIHPHSIRANVENQWRKQIEELDDYAKV